MSKQETLPAEKSAIASVEDQPIKEYAPAFKVVKAVTRPVLKCGTSPEFIRVEGPIHRGEPMKGTKIAEAPYLMDIINLRTGEAALMICPTVFRNELEKGYPKESYVGKDFQIRKITTEGKAYSLWSITEIELN